MGKIWLTADNHFCHRNILVYCDKTRKFADICEMNQVLVDRWNEVVKDEDEVYHLGDFAMGPNDAIRHIMKSLKGKIYLIRGNHDKGIKSGMTERFEWIKDYHELKVEDEEMDVCQTIVLFHYPLLTWNKMYHGSWMAHAHSHGGLPESDSIARLDVGVDVHNLYPIEYEKVKEIMTKKVFKAPEDHYSRPRDD